MRLQPTYVDVRRLRQLLDDGRVQEADTAVITLGPAELADVLLQLDALELARLQPRLGRQRLAGALAELDSSEAARLITRFSRAIAADILEDMEPDDATDVVGELKPAEAEAILHEMPSAEAEEIRGLMTYLPHTAGGRMTTEFISISPELTVAAALRLLRTQAPNAETIYSVYVSGAGRPADWCGEPARARHGGPAEAHRLGDAAPGSPCPGRRRSRGGGAPSGGERPACASRRGRGWPPPRHDHRG
jgi:hypothetical protein